MPNIKNIYAPAAIILIGTICGWTAHLTDTMLIDDAYVSFRYAQNLAAGNGLVFNIGEYLAGYTNFLYTCIIGFFYFCGLNITDSVKWIGFTSLTLSAISIYFSLIHRFGSKTAFIISTLSSFNPLMLKFATFGLETTFFASLAALAFSFYVNKKYTQSAITLSFLILTRLDGIVIYVAFLLNSLQLFSKRQFLNFIFPVFITITIYEFWFYFYYQDIFPNTYFAKSTSGYPVYERGIQYILQSGRNKLGYLISGLIIFGGTILAFLSFRRLVNRSLISPPCLKLIAEFKPVFFSVIFYLFYIIHVGGDWMGPRFLIHILPLAIMCSAYSYLMILEFFRLSSIRYQNMASLTVITLFVSAVLDPNNGLSSISLFHVDSKFEHSAAAGFKKIGLWLNQNAEDGQLLATCPAGFIPYFAGSKIRAFDTLGLTDRHIARLAHRPKTREQLGPAGHEKQDNLYVVNIRKPDFIACDTFDDGQQGGVYGPLNPIPFKDIFEYRRWYEPILLLNKKTAEIQNIDGGDIQNIVHNFEPDSTYLFSLVQRNARAKNSVDFLKSDLINLSRPIAPHETSDLAEIDITNTPGFAFSLRQWINPGHYTFLMSVDALPSDLISTFHVDYWSEVTKERRVFDGGRKLEIDFDVSDEESKGFFEFRVWTEGKAKLFIQSIRLRVR